MLFPPLSERERERQREAFLTNQHQGRQAHLISRLCLVFIVFGFATTAVLVSVIFTNSYTDSLTAFAVPAQKHLPKVTDLRGPKVLAMQGEVLGVSTKKPATVTTVASKTLSQPDIEKLIEQKFNGLAASGRFKGEKGDKGEQGPAGFSPFIFPANPSANFSGGTVLSATDLSGQRVSGSQVNISNTLTNTGSTNLQGNLTASGETNLATTTISSLTVHGKLSGDFTISTTTLSGTLTTGDILPVVAGQYLANSYTNIADNVYTLHSYPNGALAKGLDGFARIVYYDVDQNLDYVRCTNDSCLVKTVTVIESGIGDSGPAASITIGSNGYARIAYYNSNDGSVKYALCNDDACSAPTINVVDPSAIVGWSGIERTSMAIGSDGLSRIAYYDDTSGELRYAVCADMACSSSKISVITGPSASKVTVGNIPYTPNDKLGKNASLVLDQNNNPFIAYKHGSPNTGGFWELARYVGFNGNGCYNNTSWNCTIIEAKGLGGSMVLGPDGFPRIAYVYAPGIPNDYSSSLRYAKCTDLDCSSVNPVTLDDQAYVGESAAIVVGNDGNPVVAYRNNNNQLGYIHCGDSGCSALATASTILDQNASKNNWDGFPYMVLSDSGTPMISYVRDNTLEFIRLAANDGNSLLLGASLGSAASSFGQIYTGRINANEYYLNGVKLQASPWNILDSRHIIYKGFTTLAGGVQIRPANTTGDSPWWYYPNIVSYSYNGNSTGTFVVHTNINRDTNEMFKIRVNGYGYGNGTNVDFTVVGYAYNAAKGSVDGQYGALINYSINDNGNDGLPKWLGVDANGKVAVAFGRTTDTYYYYRLSVDYSSTRAQIDTADGWSVDTSTTTGFGFKDVHPLNPGVTQLANGNVGIGTTTPLSKLDLYANNVANANALTFSGLPQSTTDIIRVRENSSGSGWRLQSAGGSQELFYLTDLNGNVKFKVDTVGGTGAYFNVGNVGIGTVSPSAKLDISQTANNYAVIARGSSTPAFMGTDKGVLLINDHSPAGYGNAAIDFTFADHGTYPTARISVENSSAGSVMKFGTSNNFSSGVTNTAITINQNGYLGIGTTTPGHLITLSGGAYSDGASWQNVSDTSLKENFATVTPSDILSKIVNLPISKWNYRSEDSSVTHIGPTAQDFYAAFNLNGEDGKSSISTIDPSGIALLGIQALNQKITALQGSLTSNATATTLSVYFPSRFSGDSVGEAKILAGAASVRITFKQAYEYQPIVTFSPESFSIEGFIQEKDTSGFTLALSTATTTDVVFDWHSFASPEAKLTVSDGTAEDIVLVVPTAPAIITEANPAIPVVETPVIETASSTVDTMGGEVAGTSTAETIQTVSEEQGIISPQPATEYISPTEPTVSSEVAE